MKKILIAVLGIALCAASVFANEGKIYSVNDEVYKYIASLCIAEKKGLPNSSGPWSQAELEAVVANLPVTYENETSQKLYDKIVQLLNKSARFNPEEGLALNAKGCFNPELYVHTNKEFDDESDWYYGYEQRHDFLNFNGDISVGNAFYACMDAGLGFVSGNAEGTGVNPLYSKNFMVNIPYVTWGNFGDLNKQYPQRGIFALGGKHWNVSAGRDIMRWGNGETGNLMLGGNALFDNSFRFAIFGDRAKFSFVSIYYPHPSNYTAGDSGYVNEQNDLVDGFLMFMAHKLDFNFLDHRLNVGLGESVMYQSKSNTLDIRVFNPLLIYHNLFMRGQCNSMMILDADFAVMRGLNVYGQVVLDEFAFFGEPTGASTTGWRPQKMGFMLGSKYVLPTQIGLFRFNAEGVYTDPCLYLREKYEKDSGKYGVSFYGTLKDWQNNGGSYGANSVSFLRNCIGYAYGGDAVVGDFKVSYDSLKNYKAGFETFFMAHGIMYNDLNSDWMHGNKTTSPSSEDKTDNPSNAAGEVTYILRVSLNGSYEIFQWLEVYGRMDNYIVTNKDHVASAPKWDTQLIIGTKISW